MKQTKVNMHAAQLKRMRGKPTVTSSSRIPGRPYELGEEAWYARADTQIARFVREQRAALEAVFAVEMVLSVCADLVWEHRRGEPAWDQLLVDELWLRLTIQDEMMPQPLLVLAFHDGLQLFLPWLVAKGALRPEACAFQLSELARVRSPLFDAACAMLREPEGAPS